MEDEDNLDNINIEEIDKDLYNEENSNLEQDNNILDKERLSENSKNEEQLKGRLTADFWIKIKKMIQLIFQRIMIA